MVVSGRDGQTGEPADAILGSGDGEDFLVRRKNHVKMFALQQLGQELDECGRIGGEAGRTDPAMHKPRKTALTDSGRVEDVDFMITAQCVEDRAGRATRALGEQHSRSNGVGHRGSGFPREISHRRRDWRCGKNRDRLETF
jgi:hypothetical protein